MRPSFSSKLSSTSGDEFEIVVIADQARVAVERHHPDVALVAHQHAQRAAMATGRAALAGDGRRCAGAAARADRPPAAVPACDLRREERAVDQRSRAASATAARARQAGRDQGGRAERDDAATGRVSSAHQANSLTSAPGCARTKCPSPSGRCVSAGPSALLAEGRLPMASNPTRRPARPA